MRKVLVLLLVLYASLIACEFREDPRANAAEAKFRAAVAAELAVGDPESAVLAFFRRHSLTPGRSREGALTYWVWLYKSPDGAQKVRLLVELSAEHKVHRAEVENFRTHF
jgi:hypothetical protein